MLLSQRLSSYKWGRGWNTQKERSSIYTAQHFSSQTKNILLLLPITLSCFQSSELRVRPLCLRLCERDVCEDTWTLQPRPWCVLPSTPLARAAWTLLYNHYQSLWQSCPPSPPPLPSAPGLLSVVINGTRAPARLTLPVPAMFPWYLMNSDKLLFPCSVVPFPLRHPAHPCLKCTAQSCHCSTLGLALVLCKFLKRPESKNTA